MSKKKKGARESSPPTNVSSPIRGANQDQSGYGVKHSTADYTISDETQYDEGFVAGVGSVRATPVQMSTNPRPGKGRNAPRNVAGMQRAADKRRMQLDRIAQKRAAMQKKIGRRQQNEELSLTNLAKKVGAESKAKMPKDKLTHSFKKFSDFSRAIDEANINESSGKYNEKEPAHVAARKSTSGFGSYMEPHYHEDGSATIKVHGKENGVSSVRMVDHHHDVSGLGHNRSARSYAKLTKKKGGLIHSTKKTGPDSHEIHIMKEEAELEESHSELNKHISEFSKGVKSSAPKQSRNKIDNKPIHNMKYVETDSDHQKVFNHLKKMGYKKTSGYDPHPNGFSMHYNSHSMTEKSDPVHHAAGISAHVEHEHGEKLKVHFIHRGIKEEVENLEEGRPKKNATSEDPGSEHIVMQLRKAISLRGQHPVKFVDGKSSLVSPSTAHRLLNMHDNMKTAAEKDHFAKHIHKSVDHMRDALAGKMPAPEKKTISLGGGHGDRRR